MAKQEAGKKVGEGKNAISINIIALVALFIAVWFVLRTALRGELGAASEPVLAAFFLIMLALWWRKRQFDKAA